MLIRWIVALLLSLLLAAGACYVAATDWYAVQYGWAKPWWLLLLAILPPLAVMAWPALGNLGQLRRVLVLGLRLGLFICLILALAELSTARKEEGMTLIVLVDRSFSIPQEMSAGSVRDARWDRLVTSVKQATRDRLKAQDRVGVISFAARPRLEYPASDIPELNMRDIGASLDRNLTDIGGAIRLALASFPEGAARRILLISDGNENRGNAENEARTAKINGVPIDVVPLKYKYDDEILVDRLDVPSESRPGQDIPLRVIVRNYAGRPVPGKLRITRQMGSNTEQAEERHTLDPGLNVISAKWPSRFGPGVGMINYKANFFPDRLPSDRQDNNESTAPVMLTNNGRRILLVVQDTSKRSHEALVQALKERPGVHGQRVIDIWPADSLPADNDDGRFKLSSYDTIILFNLPSEAVPRTQQEAIRKTVRDQGTGLVVIGGPVSFGAGGWQNEPLEEAMPVDNALRSRKVQAKGGLALIMHASEMEEGNYWQKEIAKLAISKLGPHDEVGILYYSYNVANGNNGHVWHVPLQEVGEDKNRAAILSALGSMQPGDMPEFDPSLNMAHDSLTEEKRGIATKHVILISDGDHGLLTNGTILDKYKKNRVTLTTIGITTHGPAAQAALAAISKATGGRHYAVDDPKMLPSIYVKETRVLNQSHLYLKAFTPRLTSEIGDPFREWAKGFPQLHGFVRTSRKESNLVQVLMQAPLAGEDENPILAQWQYGLGRSVAFTSDAMGDAGSWARDWIAPNNAPLYGDFWTRIVDWSMRNLDEGGTSMQTRYENGKMRVTLIDNRDREQRAANPLGAIKATIGSSHSAESKEVTLEPIAAGVYEGVIESSQAGNYSVAASTIVKEKEKDKNGNPVVRSKIVGRGALAVPYSPEFATVEDNEGMLQRVAEITGGRVLDEKTLGTENLFIHDGSYARRLQPLWHWLLFAAAVLLVTDAAIRRIAVDPMAAVRQGRRVVENIRGQKELPETSQEYLGRLRKGKAAAAVPQGQAAPVEVASRRFEAPTTFEGQLETPTTTLPATPVAKPKAPAASEADDFAARLMKAKQKAREEIDGQKDSQ
jgi:uncharacterized membrane protein